MGSPNPTSWRRRSLDEVLGALKATGGQPTQSGDGWMACCPAHDDTTPSLSIRAGDDGSALINCFAGCQAASVLAALQLPGGVLVPASASPGSTTKKGVAVQPKAPSEADYAALAAWLAERAAALADGSPLATEALEYAARRWGLTSDDCATLGLGLDPGSREVTRPGFAAGMAGAPRIVVPFLDDHGAPRGCQGRALSPTAKVRWSGLKGAGWPGLGYLGLDREDRPVLVCEGPGDALTAYGAGYPVAFIAGAGRAKRAVSTLAPVIIGRQVVVAGDNDQAGEVFDRHLEAGLGAVPLAIPDGVKDLSAWREGDPARFGPQFEAAVEIALSTGNVESLASITPLSLVGTKPTCDVSLSGQLSTVTSEAIRVLVAANDPPALFVRGGSIARVRADEHGRPVVETASAEVIRYALGEAARWTASHIRGECDATPSLGLARNVLAKGAWGLPPLNGVVEAPVIRPDGSVLAAPGYDTATHLLYVPSEGLSVPPVPERPSGAELAAAVALIDEALGDFPFSNRASRAGAWGLLLTAVLRPAIEGSVPLCLIDAPQRGTGKSLLCELISMIVTGRPAAMMAAPDTKAGDDEWRKRLTSTLLGAPQLVVIDNVEHTLHSSSLSIALSATEWTDRVLGRSEMIRLPIRATWVATGNNLSVAADLVRRCHLVRLDSQQARPWLRTEFRHPDLLDWAREHRGQLLGALLIVARSWIVSGRSVPAGTQSVGGYGSWAKTLGGVLAHCGVDGFLSGLDAFYDTADEEGAEWEAFLGAWRARFGTDRATIATVAHVIAEDKSLTDTVPSVLTAALGTTAFRSRLGQHLRSRVGRRYGKRQLRIEQGPQTRQGVGTWSVVESEELAPANTGVS